MNQLFEVLNKDFQLPKCQPIISGIFTKSDKDIRTGRLFELYDKFIIYYKGKQRKNASKKININFQLKFQMIRVQQQISSRSRSSGSKKDLSQIKKKPNNPYGISFQKGQVIFSIYSQDVKLLITWRDQLTKKINQRGFHQLFKPIKKIGKGNFASVYLAQRLEDNKKFAIKAFSKQATFAEDKGKQSLINEIQIMRNLNHKNLMKLHQVYQSENSIYICVQLLEGGQLYDAIKQKRKFTRTQIKIILKGLLQGLQHMHSKRYMHRDIKPQNIILRQEGDWDVVIADFGLSTFADQLQYLYVRCGTPGYVAPEIVNLKDLKAKCNPICDVFSVGLIFHILQYLIIRLTGKSCFPGKTYNEVLLQNRACNINFEIPELKKVQQSALDLLKKMLQKNPENRITATNALKHQYFQCINQNQVKQNNQKQLSNISKQQQIVFDSPMIPSKKNKETLKDDSCVKFYMKENVITGKTTQAQGSDVNIDSPNLRKSVQQSRFCGEKEKEMSKFGIGAKGKQKEKQKQKYASKLADKLKSIDDI